MERFEKFPLTTEQLEMLLAGNVCDYEPFYSTFEFTPLSLSDYLTGGLGARTVALNGVVREGAAGPAAPRIGEKVQPNKEEPPFRKSA
jgi:hypothetical protein